MMFTPGQAEAVRLALRKGLHKDLHEPDPAAGLGARLQDALAKTDAAPARFTADQLDDVRTALRADPTPAPRLRDRLGRALAGLEGAPTDGVDGPADEGTELADEPKLLDEPTSPKVGFGRVGSAHSFQAAGRKVSVDGGDPTTFCWSL